MRKTVIIIMILVFVMSTTTYAEVDKEKEKKVQIETKISTKEDGIKRNKGLRLKELDGSDSDGSLTV